MCSESRFYDSIGIILCHTLPMYTSILGVDVPTLEQNFGIPITVADRCRRRRRRCRLRC
jgi:hypothetical protein